MNGLGSLTVKRLGPPHAAELEAYLRRDEIAYIYPLGWLRRDGVVPRVHYLDFSFLGVYAGHELVGAGMLAGGVLLFVACRDSETALALGGTSYLRHQGFHVVVGPRPAVESVRVALRARGFRERLARPQVVYAVTPETLERLAEPHLRRAVSEDLPAVLRATLDMHEHETLERPLAQDVEGFRRSVEYQIHLGRIFVLFDPDDGELRFKAALSVQCDAGTQVEGVFVPPVYRRQGHARRCLSELCQRLFEQAPLVSLYVNEDNGPAVALYDDLGFARALDYETVFLVR